MPHAAMWDAPTLLLVALVFLLGGFVKGVVGMGLPTIAIALLATFIGLKEGIAIMLVPTLLSNVWQALAGGQAGPIARRIWPMLALLFVFTFAGAGILARGDAVLLAAVLGTLLVLYSAYSLTRPQLPPPGRHERWMTPAVGALAGLVNGMTGSFAVPGVVYLQALGLPRDTLVQAMGVAFLLGAFSLGLALAGVGLFPAELGLLSTLALAPTFLGMWIGQGVRRRIPEQAFRRVFFLALAVLGLWLALRPFWG